MMSFPVGFLVAAPGGFAVICGECAGRHREGVFPLYHRDIYPCNQTCAGCGETLVVGRSPDAPQYFPTHRSNT